MKKASILFTGLFLSLGIISLVYADAAEAIEAYTQELIAVGMDENQAASRAESEVNNVLSGMEGSQQDVATSVEALEDRVDSLSNNDGRKDSAESALDTAKDRRDDFTDLSREDHLFVQEAIAGALPFVAPDSVFTQAEEAANEALTEVNRVLLAPDRPGAVPEGDIVSDFIPQVIRQLFRFAWVAVLISFTVSGVFLVMAHDNEEKITKAKQMIYYSMIGFAFVSLAFAIVKAITDIDFFRFI